MPERGYAVICLKTTGLFPYQRDRVVEIAVVHLDEGGRTTARWQTVVNPGINAGDVASHGVSTAELLRAPTFEQIAPRLVDLLRGRVLVTHNAQFVTGFLMREFELIDYASGGGLEAVCTMHLARRYLPGAGRLLIDCCAAYDIEIGPGPSALVQAVACASLLAAYVHGSPSAAPWIDALDRAERRVLLPIVATGAPAAEWVERDPVTARSMVPIPSFLARAAVKLPDYAGPEEHLDYLALLDLCLVDRVLSPRESTEVRFLAEFSGIGPEERIALHRRYFEDLVHVAWLNGALSTSDCADVIAVGRMLDVDPEVVAAALTEPSAVTRPAVAPVDAMLLEQGDVVVLTGDMARARSDWARELVARGLALEAAVTLRTRLLVAADPASVTGKTVKARDYGIPIVSEFGLRSLIGVR
ncbi:exonuclease domain-containing protein [Cryobacterium sp. PH29-G1]|uniref:exonuclease domain-containing protein n=1 Tax=Cryobacterium sp. PH29-G1 TaxID=3046211 RepID=UPI0024B8B3FD|nr:exonuclease domain-containing protein [Cryobacterium sp. PH29-G1]MDJ0349799.1 exonuclease domain-containing protein [Cryobacterium sp. PH29-G1]